MNKHETKKHACSCSHGSIHEEHENENGIKKYIPVALSFILLSISLSLDHIFENTFFKNEIRLAGYILAYLPVAIPVMREMFSEFRKKDFFNEFSLMVIATIGAFSIKEYPEAVAIMLFYSVGELFQQAAVNKAKRNIKSLLDMRPKTANLLKKGVYVEVPVETVLVGDIIQVKIGEKVPLDGFMLSNNSSFDTSALTGESRPKTIRKEEKVLAGMLNLEKVIELKVEKEYFDSSLSKILSLVEEATEKKAKPELLIRKFAKIYTPCVFFIALLIVFLPYFFVESYEFKDWLYRALVMLVISCPCALVISIPLGYFGGIGAASKNGILFKGANYLDLLLKVNTIIFDKTGTLTKGVFKVQKVSAAAATTTEKEVLRFAKAIESHSNHPIAKAIVQYADKIELNGLKVEDIEELAGLGMLGKIDGKEVLAGNTKFMKLKHIDYHKEADNNADTCVAIAYNNVFLGYISISDEIKKDAKQSIEELHKAGIKEIIMLSGDKESITKGVAKELGIKTAYGDLLPVAKLKYIEKLKREKSSRVIAFVGDGINDSPVLALSDIGIAMGGMGADIAVEIADIVIQTDQPLKIVTAIKIAKATKRTVIENIILSFGVKALVLLLAGFGLATMWQAVFADVGVALLAILNAILILRKKF